MTGGRLRAAWGGLCFALCSLAFLRAPTSALWLAALLVTEGGRWLFLAPLLTLWPGWKATCAGRAGAALGLAAAALALLPLARAAATARALGLRPLTVSAAPRVLTDAPARPAPLVWRDLYRGVRSPDVRESAEIYVRPEGKSLTLELYRPKAASGPLPVVLFIHGGSWESGGRLDMPELARYLAARGYAAASIDYRLAPGAAFPAPVEDARAALAFLKANAARWSLDPGRVALVGRSAGAQIALAAAYGPKPLPGIRGVVDFYGPNDLWLAWTVPGNPRVIDSRRLLRQYLGGEPSQVPAVYDAASPILAVGPQSPPTLMIHGGRDELVWPLHEVRLSRALTAAGVPNDFLELPWATHGCDYFASGPCGQISTWAVERFLAAVLR